MLTHIVIWKYRPEVAPDEREEHAMKLRALSKVIPEIVSFAVGFDVLRLPRSYHLGLVAVFRDRAGLDAYTNHPDHLEVAAIGRQVAEHIASVDFEGEN
ncbi:MAG: Dabb family protein [Pyrinomonadaceae bacterium]